MDLDSGAIYSIQRWLEYENTPSMRVAIHRDIRKTERWALTQATFETATLDRDVFKCHQWMVELATLRDSHLPIMYGKPMTLEEYHEKKGRI